MPIESSLRFRSKLPHVGTTVFTVMSKLAAEHGAVNLSQGFPDFDCAPALVELAARHLRAGHNQYAPMAGIPELRRAVAEKTEALYGASYDPELEVTVTPGATYAIFTTIAATVRPGDEVVVLEPAYDSYGPAVEVQGGVVVPVRLPFPDYAVDWRKVARAISPRTRMIVVNSPHNPTGTMLSPADLNALAALVRDTDIVVLADEVYEHIVFDGRRHASVAGHVELAARSFVVSSFGKTFHATGWKVGYCLAPRLLSEEFRKVHQFNGFAVHTPTQHALAEYLEDRATWQAVAAFYQRKRDLLDGLLAGSRLEPLPCAGTYFRLYRYDRISDEDDAALAARLTRERGVATIPVSAFYREPPGDRVLRLCFAKRDETLAQAAQRLREI